MRFYVDIVMGRYSTTLRAHLFDKIDFFLLFCPIGHRASAAGAKQDFTRILLCSCQNRQCASLGSCSTTLRAHFLQTWFLLAVLLPSATAQARFGKTARINQFCQTNVLAKLLKSYSSQYFAIWPFNMSLMIWSSRSTVLATLTHVWVYANKIGMFFEKRVEFHYCI